MPNTKPCPKCGGTWMRYRQYRCPGCGLSRYEEIPRDTGSESFRGRVKAQARARQRVVDEHFEQYQTYYAEELEKLDLEPDERLRWKPEARPRFRLADKEATA